MQIWKSDFRSYFHKKRCTLTIILSYFSYFRSFPFWRSCTNTFSLSHTHTHTHTQLAHLHTLTHAQTLTHTQDYNARVTPNNNDCMPSSLIDCRCCWNSPEKNLTFRWKICSKLKVLHKVGKEKFICLPPKNYCVSELSW
jgi:hypothetical protein